MNKKGNVYFILIFFVALLLVLFMGVIMIVGSSVMNWVFDEVTPELTSLGTVGNFNVTQAGEITLNPINNVIQQATWVTGLIYVLMLVGIIAFSFIAKSSSNTRWTIGFFIAMMLLLILVSIFVSNIYEDFSTGDNDLTNRLREHTLLDFMIIHSPLILFVIAVIGGIIIYSGISREVSI